MIYTRPWLRDVWLQLIAAIAVWWNPSRLFGEIHPDYLVKSTQTRGNADVWFSGYNLINCQCNQWFNLRPGRWCWLLKLRSRWIRSITSLLSRLKRRRRKTHFYDDLHLAVSRFPSLTKMIMKMISKKSCDSSQNADYCCRSTSDLTAGNSRLQSALVERVTKVGFLDKKTWKFVIDIEKCLQYAGIPK